MLFLMQLSSLQHLRHDVHRILHLRADSAGAVHLSHECIILCQLLGGHTHGLGCPIKQGYVTVVPWGLVDLSFDGLEGACEVQRGLSQVGVKLGDPECVVILALVYAVPKIKAGVIDVNVLERLPDTAIRTEEEPRRKTAELHQE